MKSIPTCILCLSFYFMAGLGLCIEFLPPDAMAIFGGKPRGDTLEVSLAVSSACLILGAILHAVFYRLNPERFNASAFRFAGIGMIALMAGLFVLSAILSRATGLPPVALKGRFDTVMEWIVAMIIGGAATLLAVALAVVAVIVVRIKYHPGNRMARRLAAGDATGAIRIGEARPKHKRDFTTNVNLVVAYVSAGRKEEAQRLMAILEQTDKVPKYYTEESLAQTLDGLRKVIAECPQRATSPSVEPDKDNP